jgi:SAM-dependent methyltransferase
MFEDIHIRKRSIRRYASDIRVIRGVFAVGFDYNTTRFVLFSKKRGVDLSRPVTLGRQSLFLHPKELRHVLKNFGSSITEEEQSHIYEGSDLAKGLSAPADKLLEYLGAERVDSIDASGYEGATILHDMNSPIPEIHHGRYSAIIDGGTLEHIFNLPVAIDNCMKLLKPGGHMIGISPCNNFLGHGFYQFSPEFFFRLFSEPNGFRTKTMVLTEVKSRSDWYEILDPDVIQRRLVLQSHGESYLMMIAEKLRPEAGIHVMPQQSDYENVLWEGQTLGGWNRRMAMLNRIKRRVPVSWMNVAIPIRARFKNALMRPFQDPSVKRIDPSR